MGTSASSNALNLVTVSEGLKEHYQDFRIKNMVYKNNPLLGLLPKYTNFTGSDMPIPLRYHDPQRRSATFSLAQGNKSTSGLERFLIKRVHDYSFAYIDGETMQAARGDSGSFIRYLTMEIDGAMNSLTRSLAVSLYRDGSGSIAKQSGAAVTATGKWDVITLASSEDVTNFEVGMQVVASANTGTNPGTAVKVTAVDRANGTISLGAVGTATPTAGAASTGGFDAGDLIFQEGDFTAAAVSDSKKLKIVGLDGWLPKDAPGSSDSHFGVNRSSDATRLGGVRFDGSSMPIEEALMEGASLVARDGGAPDVAFCDYKTYVSLEKSLGSRVRYNSVSSPDADIGFSGIELVSPSGTMKIIPDQNCIADTVFLLQMDTWQLASLNACPQFLDADNNRILRDAGEDAYECRLGYYAQLACYAPGFNCRINLA